MTTHDPVSLDLSTPATAGGQASLIRRLARKLFAISPGATSFAERGFRCDEPAIRERLEGVASCFVRGYHAALEVDPPELVARLQSEPPALRGFAFEGAALAMTILDTTTGWMTGRRVGRLRSFLDGAGDAHAYIVHVGAGWALARLPLRVTALLRRLDPVLGWLALDGYGFHEGFFHAGRSVTRRQVPAQVKGYSRRAFDQGLGRSLWFVEGAHVPRIGAIIGTFPEARRADLWSGVGLACAYAGGRGRADLETLRHAAQPWTRELAQGAAFAAAARNRAANPTPEAELACQVLCGTGLEGAAAIADAAGQDLPPDAPATLPAFEVWRRRIQESFPADG
jgi:hypothetical protein